MLNVLFAKYTVNRLLLWRTIIIKISCNLRNEVKIIVELVNITVNTVRKIKRCDITVGTHNSTRYNRVVVVVVVVVLVVVVVVCLYYLFQLLEYTI